MIKYKEIKWAERGVTEFQYSNLSSTFRCPTVSYKAICNKMSVKLASFVSGSVNLAVSAALATQVWWNQGLTSGALTCCKMSKMLAKRFLARNALQHLPSEILGDFHLVTLSDYIYSS